MITTLSSASSSVCSPGRTSDTPSTAFAVSATASAAAGVVMITTGDHTGREGRGDRPQPVHRLGLGPEGVGLAQAEAVVVVPRLSRPATAPIRGSPRSDAGRGQADPAPAPTRLLAVRIVDVRRGTSGQNSPRGETTRAAGRTTNPNTRAVAIPRAPSRLSAGSPGLARMLARVDATDGDIAAVDAQIGEHLAPFGDAVARLDEIPGIGPTAAAIVIAEIGLDMTRFPTPAHLTSWAKFAPGINSSAGKTRGNGSTGHGNRYLARVLGEAAVGAGRTDTFLGARYRRIVRRRGKKKAVVAVGRSLLVIIWHLLADPTARFHDLGADHYDRHVNTTAKRRNHIHQLEALGYKVTLEPAA